jgi:hypothetical protein
VRLRVDLFLEDALGACDRETDHLAAQLIARAVALELDLRLGAREGLLALEARGLARFVEDLVRLRARLRFDRERPGAGFLDDLVGTALRFRQVLLTLLGGGEARRRSSSRARSSRRG